MSHRFCASRSFFALESPTKKKSCNTSICMRKLQDNQCPDFNPCGFFSWGFMKEQVYAKEVNNRDELLMRINYVADIRRTLNLLEKTWNSLHRRMERCIEVNGGHIEKLL
ncbi:hypothetical protein QTP88_018056 [Uroleucon formosanum]